MDSTIFNDLSSVGVAAIIVVMILKVVFDFLKSKEAKNNINESSKKYAKDISCLDLEESRMLKIMSIEIGEIYNTLQITQVFQKSVASIMENQTQLAAVLNEIRQLNKNTMEMLGHIQKLTIQMSEVNEDEDHDSNL